MKTLVSFLRPTQVATALLCAITWSAAAPAAAAGPELPRWYVTGFIGTSQISDPATRFKPTGGTESSGTLKLGSGSLNGGSIGTFLTPNLRAEAEIVYRTNKVTSASVAGIDAAQSGADLASLMLMANLIKDFDGFSTSFATFKPYLGAGLGVAQEIDSDLRVSGTTTEFSGNRAAYQALAGMNWYYRSGWFAGAGVRWVDAGSAKLKGTGTPGGDLTVDYKGVSGELRVGYRF
jgi:opacity protein-like surface antigen